MAGVIPVFEGHGIQLWHGDCLEVLRELPDNSVDSVCTDPPYSWAFMSRAWDSHPSPLAFQQWCQQWAAQCFRVLKPGAHLLAFGGPRTVHRLTTGIEDAGFEIRDSITWVYASGFPKSLDVGKALDRANGRQFEDRYALGRHIRERRGALGLTVAEVNGWFGYRDGCQHWERQDPHGARVPTLADWQVLRERLGLSEEWLPLVERVEAEREVVGSRTDVATRIYDNGEGPRLPDRIDVTAPATEAAKQWQGWGTALKPASEPVVVARKPLQGTVAQSVLRWGTGALNVDATRVGYGAGESTESVAKGATKFGGVFGNGAPVVSEPTAGRWPANLVLTHADCPEGGPCQAGCPVAELDAQSGESGGSFSGPSARVSNNGLGLGTTERREGSSQAPDQYGDSGGASRFFATFRHGPNDDVFLPVESDAWQPPGDGSTRDASTSAGRKPGSSDGNSPTDGSGSKPTDPSPTATKSTTATTTPSTTTSTTSCASPPSGTTTTTSGSENSTDGSMGSNSASASDAGSGNPPTGSPSDGQAHSTATASAAPSPTAESGQPDTAMSSTPSAGRSGPPASTGEFPVFKYEPKAASVERVRGETSHPTVKPLDLMRWLVRLVTPPGGVCLDPFLGSGTTAEACLLEGFRCIGIEREAEYLPLIRQRIDRRRDPVAFHRSTGTDAGTLFEGLE